MHSKRDLHKERMRALMLDRAQHTATKYELAGEMFTVRELAEIADIKWPIMYRRLKRMSAAEAVAVKCCRRKSD